MQQDPSPRNVQQVGKTPTFALLTTREMRAHAVHRLQVGLFGLCAMLLLVGLANIIMDRARLSEDEDPASASAEATEGTKAASDPLADIGVIPAADPSTSPKQDR